MAKKPALNPEEALTRALKFLSYRARSEAEVRTKLTQLGFPEKVTEATLRKLRSLKLLDDEVFARNWALARAEGRGYGPWRIERELQQKGVAKSLISQVLRETLSGQGTKEKARDLVKRRFRDEDLADIKILRRAVGFLQRRGYPYPVIAEVLKQPVGDE